MDAPQISIILNSWATALKEGNNNKRSRASLNDLVEKYSLDDHTEKTLNSSKKSSVRPWSREDFNKRLLTFHQSAAWFAKPHKVSALQCARHGWCNGGTDQIHCLTCGAKVMHSKGDDDGNILCDALRTGHSSHCGWRDNFCAEDFLNYPLTSSESLRTGLLQRVRLTLMALTEWVRHLSDSEEDETPNSDAAPIGKNIVNNRLRVQVGSVMNSSAPRLSKWLLDGPCRDTVERVLGITVSDMSSLSCRSCLAIAVDKIDSFLDTSIGSDFLSKSSTLSAAVHDILAGGSEDAMCSEDEVVSPVLQALLIPAADTNSSSEPECAARMIRISVLIAVCGWTPVVATTLAAAPSSSAANSAQTSSNNSPAITKKAPSNVTVSGLETFHCNLCGRSFPFKYLFTSATPVDPLFQHRTFCQWAHADLGDAITDLINGQLHADNIPGWLQCANSLYPQRGQEVRGSTAGGAALGEKRNQSSPLSLIHNKGERCGDAEQAYKKIKLVLDMAAFPRVSKADETRSGFNISDKMLFSYTHNIDDDDRVLQRVIRFEIWLKLRDEVHLCVADGADN